MSYITKDTIEFYAMLAFIALAIGLVIGVFAKVFGLY